MPRALRTAPVLLLLLAAACASGGTSTDTAPEPSRPAGGTTTTATPAPASGNTTVKPAPPQPTAWPVQTREHIDLWLHGYALLYKDTTRVPYFRRGYRDALVIAKNQAGVVTQLDANRDKLAQRLAAKPELFNTQFVAMYFDSWDELRQSIDWFIKAEGDPRRASSQETARILAFLAQNFPTAADRDWLRLFAQSLEDERAKFYHGYWLRQQSERATTLASVDAVWQRALPRLRPFLRNTRQDGGRLLLSLPLGGEGRTINAGARENTVAVTFPERAADADEAVYVFAHEAALNVASSAVQDNITPAESRSGLGDAYTAAASVRAGYLLLEKTNPDMAEGYARYYLRAAGVTPSGDARAQLERTFPLPQTIAAALQRQLEVVLGGI